MKVRDLIERLEYLESQNGNLSVKVDSIDYYLDIHNIVDVFEEDDRIKIIIK